MAGAGSKVEHDDGKLAKVDHLTLRQLRELDDEAVRACLADSPRGADSAARFSNYI